MHEEARLTQLSRSTISKYNQYAEPQNYIDLLRRVDDIANGVYVVLVPTTNRNITKCNMYHEILRVM